MKVALQVGFVLGVFTVSMTAAAQGRGRFGEAGQVSLGVERVFGFNWTKESDHRDSYTSLSLFGASGLEAAVPPYSIPRFALDYFAAENVSLGLGAHVSHVSLGNDSGDSLTIFGFNPRVGFVVPIGDSFSFWPRAGVTYRHMNWGGGGASSYLLAGTLEAQFVASPVRHVGFMFGPTADIGMAATGHSFTQIGVQAGLLGWF